MPQKPDRDEDEAVIAGGLSKLFADTRSDLDRDKRVNWDNFRKKANAAIEPTLDDVFGLVFVLLIMQTGTASGASLWAKQQSSLVSASLTDNLRVQIQGGAEPSRVLTSGRASSLAATEVTRAISAGERAARQANARDAPEDGRQQPRAPQLPRGLAIQDGLIATWETEDDERVCPICNPLDGKTEVVWLDKFPFGPPAHPKCRCWLTYKERK